MRIFLLPVLLAAACPALNAQNNQNVFNVSGSATVKVKPDEIYITCGVETLDRDVERAKSRNDEVIQRAIRFCTEAGIEPKYVQTDYVRLEPVRHEYGKPEERHYRATQGLTIILKDVKKYDQLMLGLLKSGIDIIHDVHFTTSELRKHRDEARRLAIQAAREKAELYSRELGLKLGTIENFHESWYDAYPSSMSRNSYANISQNMVQSGGASAGADSEESALSLGYILIRASVNLVYAIER